MVASHIRIVLISESFRFMGFKKNIFVHAPVSDMNFQALHEILFIIRDLKVLTKIGDPRCQHDGLWPAGRAGPAVAAEITSCLQ